jgi:antitoxin component YwqK of YwqJK toxin-antitoxin module
VVRLKGGLYEGAAYGYDESGGLTNYGRFEADQRHGVWMEFHPDGSVKASAEFAGDQKRGESQSFPPGQRLVSPPPFDGGEELRGLMSRLQEMVEAAASLRPKS